MGPASELGPVDPQLIIRHDDGFKVFSAFDVVKSYDRLFRGAVRAKGNLEPYLQQLANYDAREIQELRRALELSEDIAIKSLASGMMKKQGRSNIKKKIGIFLTPAQTKSHGRPIYRDEAADCGLAIADEDQQGPLWRCVYELYIRTNQYVSGVALKCIETHRHSFVVHNRH
jgi:hypothetical protein